jgi:hypothetical protein
MESKIAAGFAVIEIRGSNVEMSQYGNLRGDLQLPKWRTRLTGIDTIQSGPFTFEGEIKKGRR